MFLQDFSSLFLSSGSFSATEEKWLQGLRESTYILFATHSLRLLMSIKECRRATSPVTPLQYFFRNLLHMDTQIPVWQLDSEFFVDEWFIERLAKSYGMRTTQARNPWFLKKQVAGYWKRFQYYDTSKVIDLLTVKVFQLQLSFETFIIGKFVHSIILKSELKWSKYCIHMKYILTNQSSDLHISICLASIILSCYCWSLIKIYK